MPTIRIDINHLGLGMEFKELPFDSSMTLASLKDKLYPRTGTESKDQSLKLTHPEVKALDNDESTLEALGLTDGCRIDLTDTNDDSMSNNLDVGASKVEKYEAKSGDSGFAAFRKKRSKPPPATDDFDKELAELLAVGMRIRSKKTKKEGTIRFIGAIAPLPKGFWCGVELDDASGRNDGEVKGVRLFTCEANKGAVMRPSAVEIVEIVQQEGKSSKTNEDEGSDTEL